MLKQTLATKAATIHQIPRSETAAGLSISTVQSVPVGHGTSAPNSPTIQLMLSLPISQLPLFVKIVDAVTRSEQVNISPGFTVQQRGDSSVQPHPELDDRRKPDMIPKPLQNRVASQSYDKITSKQINMVKGLMRQKKISAGLIAEMIKDEFGASDAAQLSKKEASTLISRLMAK